MAAEMGSDGDSPGFSIDQPDSSVIDDELYSHKRRLKAIHDAHGRAISVRNAVEDRLITRSITEFDARRYYRAAVETFVLEVMPVLESDEISLSKDYATGVEIGEVTLRPPQQLVKYARDNIERMPPGGVVPGPRIRTLTGLRDILEAPSPFRERFTVCIQDGRNSVDVHSEIVTAEIPRDTLDRAVKTATDALEDAEMGLNIGEGRPRNNLGKDGSWPWEDDELLPHEIHDMVSNGELSRKDLEQLGDDDA